MTAIGFIGTGVMGRSMAGHLLTAGHAVHVFNRTRAKAQPLVERGAVWHDAPGGVAATADVVITMVGMPADVEEVYLGGTAAVPKGHGIIDRTRPGAILIDMTTSSPALAARIAAAAAARGLVALDAPVTGGDVGARNAALVIMVGGDAEAFARVQPILALMGKSATHLGPAGAGQRCKLANQVAVAIGMVAWCEALAHAQAGGLDPVVVQRVIAGGRPAAWPRAPGGLIDPRSCGRISSRHIHRHRAPPDRGGIPCPGGRPGRPHRACKGDRHGVAESRFSAGGGVVGGGCLRGFFHGRLAGRGCEL